MLCYHGFDIFSKTYSHFRWQNWFRIGKIYYLGCGYKAQWRILEEKWLKTMEQYSERYQKVLSHVLQTLLPFSWCTASEINQKTRNNTSKSSKCVHARHFRFYCQKRCSRVTEQGRIGPTFLLFLIVFFKVEETQFSDGRKRNIILLGLRKF